MQIITITLKYVVRTNVNLYIEVTCWSTVATWLALATKPNPHAIINPLRDIHLEGFIGAHSSRTITLGARIFDFLTCTMTGRTCLLHTEKALLHTHSPRATAGATCVWCGPRFST